ncbi:MAG TPA: hypothetical protein VFY97_06255 [Rhodanobacteraceae bacterium]|nr:hypothetical protein [Rhodanobacteraceae bacterium]
MNAADRRRLTPALALVAALLLVVLVALWLGLGRGARWRDAANPPSLPQAGTAAPLPVVSPLTDYAEVWQRPLFSPTRTPEAVGGSEEAASGNLELTGVIMLPGLRMAILHDKTNARDYRVVEGRPSREGPALVELHPRSAVVEVSGSRLQLRLIPGPAPGAGDAPQDGGAQPDEGAGQGASGMVSRQGQGQTGQVPVSGSGGRTTAEARARELKARIEAQRRRAAAGQNDDGGR